MTKFNKKLIFYIIGMLLVFNGGAMLISSLVSLIVDDGAVREITLSATIVIISGLFLISFFKNNSRKIIKEMVT